MQIENVSSDTLAARDPDGMFGQIANLADQWRAGWEAAQKIELPLSSGDLDSVVIAGMGGSAIAGDLLAGVLRPYASKAVHVSRSYDLPGFVSPRTLVVVSSYSGNTEETLSAFEDARRREAPIICLTSNGKLAEAASDHEIFTHTYPEGYPPRAAIGFSLTALLKIASLTGLSGKMSGAVDETEELLRNLGERWSDLTGNRAIDLASRLQDRLPVIYSGVDLLESVGLRWRCQLQENAQTLVIGNTIPEMNHNEIMGWADASFAYDRLTVCVLRDSEDHRRIKRRMDIVRDLIDEKAGTFVEIHSQGRARLARMMSVLYLGDWISYYLAIMKNINPTEISLISSLKAQLGGLS